MCRPPPVYLQKQLLTCMHRGQDPTFPIQMFNSSFQTQDGICNTAVGARRVLHIGEQRMFEKLTAVDDEDHIL